MNLTRFISLSLVGLSLSMAAFAQDLKQDSKTVQNLLKERTNLDFKVISNKKEPLKDASFVVVESPSKERLALLVSSDGTYIIPLTEGISSNNTNNSLRLALDNINQYNKNMKDSNVLALFQTYSNSVLKIPAAKQTKNTMYMILDTTCPYCLQEVKHIDDYLKEANIEILMVGILGQKAHNRTAGYYQELPNAKTREQKIALVKNVFKADYAPKTGNNELATRISEASLAAGVQGVPYIIRKAQ